MKKLYFQPVKMVKRIFVIALFSTLCMQNNQAQSQLYDSAMHATLSKMSNWSDSPQALAANFERIGQAVKTQWLPYYYAAYLNIIVSFHQAVELRDQTLDHAQDLLNSANTLHPDSSEILTLQGFLHIARLQADPKGRGQEYSQKASIVFDQALQLNPENPRAYYLKGSTILYTPEFYGGGKTAAKPVLTIAMAKYKAFKPASAFSPTWGENECQQLFASCQ